MCSKIKRKLPKIEAYPLIKVKCLNCTKLKTSLFKIKYYARFFSNRLE